MSPTHPAPRLILPTGGRYYCPVILPWFGFARRDTPAARLRRAAYPCMPRRNRWPWLTRLRYLLHWPLLAWLASRRAVGTWGAELERYAGVPRRRQLREVYLRCLLDNVPPHAWYLFRMWTVEGRRDAADYLQEFESHWLLRWMNGGGDPAVLVDKRRFAAACRERGVQAVDNLVELHEDGREDWSGPAGKLPPCDLFVKLAIGLCGKEAELWPYDAATRRWSNGRQSLDAFTLVQHLKPLARSSGRIVQRRVTNHPDVMPLSRQALCTLRMVTWRLPGGRSQFFHACLRMPAGDEIIDNFTPGGISAAVGADGRLLAGGRRYVEDPVERHPASGAAIRGTPIPYWEEACTLACAAQDRLGLTGAIGWDVAVTADGPLLIEGNATWGTDLMQVGAHAPFGHAELPEIVERFLKIMPQAPATRHVTA